MRPSENCLRHAGASLAVIQSVCVTGLVCAFRGACWQFNSSPDGWNFEPNDWYGFFFCERARLGSLTFLLPEWSVPKISSILRSHAPHDGIERIMLD